MQNEALLRMVGMTKTFPGVRALDGVDLEVRAGEVHALMGENGAGKSTLMKCLFGVYRPDAGDIYLDGVKTQFRSPRDALDHGVAMVHQELEQAVKMTVSDNMWLGRYPRILDPLPFIDYGECKRRTREILDSLGLSISADDRLTALSVGQRQMVEIAKAVSCGARVIVFDEPTSSLTDKEAAKLFEIIAMLKEKMCGIVYISHKMSEILEISDRVTVMRDGRLVATRDKDGLTTEEIIRMMVGRELNERYPKRDTPPGEVLFSADDLVGDGTRLKSASLNLKRGEILGIAGLEGSGRSEVLRTIFGLDRRSSGVMMLEGREVKNRNPREAKRNGFALLTEERRTDGIFGILDITDNATVASLNKWRGFLLLSSKKRSEATESCIRSMRVKTPGHKTRIRALSGGNQQKIILGRWLLTEPRVLLLDEPTRGIDVGAKYEIYVLIAELAAKGCGIIVVSSEMAELIGITDRIAVMSNGRVAGELPSTEATQEKIMTLAAKYL